MKIKWQEDETSSSYNDKIWICSVEKSSGHWYWEIVCEVSYGLDHLCYHGTSLSREDAKKACERKLMELISR